MKKFDPNITPERIEECLRFLAKQVDKGLVHRVLLDQLIVDYKNAQPRTAADEVNSIINSATM